MSLENTLSNYRELFLSERPLMDVRAPVEFDQGHFNQAFNHPLLDDQQRQQIGLRYKEQGQDAAIELGWQMATEDVLESRLQAWSGFVKQNPEGCLYCFRGGLRSRFSQQILRDHGIDYPIVEGGYKAMRQFLLKELEQACESAPLIIIAGPTGSGKTKAIHNIQRSIDLEGSANHRGSAFGQFIGSEQPAQISFENAVSQRWLQLGRDKAVVMEDEGRLIGRLNVPNIMQSAMQRAPLLQIDEPLNQRCQWVIEDYVLEPLKSVAITQFGESLQNNLYRIRKRLGGLRYQQLQKQFEEACQAWQHKPDPSPFYRPIEQLLRDYYDPMYNYQLQQRQGQVLFRGRCEEIIDWCREQRL
ncbi:tRNA 2-selenouridine(34) synthase MnmH [Pseudoteredinibacter isoporae]|uniref:tRNA 2-selenouridine synthase n=1 Tax=Pseudoteredinibacter isoporae TaxID=570281 RepID=A0A7X0MUS2_9GAMM|nr:tRNA 2-selenouridine(34) synthase MnmH [Pseudoteredinibacter isoporae]MBB6520593.1 tRNA 2-selenouridine synthase [Pseudoteredinibacter isoporae]NHO86160.1 tRNA 2-selenouridine(34) synthase MnmH [Pseudoteredinibacter isoporae]NIB25389.1 tRNA 2-selenouridine(34) synthase MnmH [Pseudoteredinibacter isoporae]